MIPLQPHPWPRRRIPNALAVIAALICVLIAWRGEPEVPPTASSTMAETESTEARYGTTAERRNTPSLPPRPLRQVLPPFIVPSP